MLIFFCDFHLTIIYLLLYQIVMQKQQIVTETRRCMLANS